MTTTAAPHPDPVLLMGRYGTLCYKCGHARARGYRRLALNRAKQCVRTYRAILDIIQPRTGACVGNVTTPYQEPTR